MSVNIKELKKFDRPFTYTTYQFYTQKGERLAIFYHEGLVEVFKCNKEDKFSKKIAKGLYSTEEADRLIEVQNFENINQFIDWCKSTFYKYIYWAIPGVVTNVEIVPQSNKMSKYHTTFKTLQIG